MNRALWLIIMPCHIFHSGISETKPNDFHGILKPMAKQLHQREVERLNRKCKNRRDVLCLFRSADDIRHFDIIIFLHTLYTIFFHLTILRIVNATFVGCAAKVIENLKRESCSFYLCSTLCGKCLMFKMTNFLKWQNVHDSGFFHRLSNELRLFQHTIYSETTQRS